jgi:hypothetical protein
VRYMDVLSHLAFALSGRRARPGPPPSRERLRELAREVNAGRYRVPVEKVAEALLRPRDPRAPRG